VLPGLGIHGILMVVFEQHSDITSIDAGRAQFEPCAAACSFDVAGVHVTVLTPYKDFSKGSHQHNWLKKDLEHNLDRRVTPWLVVAFHAPWYNTAVAHYQARNTLLVYRTCSLCIERRKACAAASCSCRQSRGEAHTASLC